MKIIDIILMIMILVIILLIIFVTVSEIIYNNTLENCKNKGWDGVKFTSRFGNNLTCSNYTQAEKDTMEENIK